MFTGIIEEVGKVASLVRSDSSCVLRVEAHTVLEDAHVGDSISVNGVCLTLTHVDAAAFSADVMNETLTRSSLGALVAGAQVNLERAMKLDGRFGGHIVTGHIDGVGQITLIRDDGNAQLITIAAPFEILNHIVEKGSVALDGISLTVAHLSADDFDVSIIPHTRAHTNFDTKRAGDGVNIELDIIGKYVERLMQSRKMGDALANRREIEPRITEEFLIENGF